MSGCRSASEPRRRSAWRFAVLVGLICALTSSGAHAGGESSTSFSHRMEQGKFLLDQGMFQQAWAEFEAAAAMPQGLADPEVHTLLARTSFKVGDVATAVEAVRTARALSGDEPSADLLELHEFLTTRFGKVLVIGANAEGAYTPVPAAPILDPELRRLSEAAIAGLGEPSGGGSTSIYLPVGTYRVGRHLVEVRAEGSTRMDLRPTVGATGSGVYGERNARNGASGRRPGRDRDSGNRRPERRPPKEVEPPSPPTPHASIRFGGQAFEQQSAPTGGARFLLGWEGHADAPFGLRISGGVTVHRLEKIEADTPAPPGVVPQLQVAAGPLFAPGRLLVAPWLVWNLGYGRTLDPALPTGYAGPQNYLVFGPDIEGRIVLPASAARSGTQVRPELVLRFMVREVRPLGPGSERDPRPHLMVGGGFDIGLLLGNP